MIVIGAVIRLVELAERSQPGPPAGGRLGIVVGSVSLGRVRVDSSPVNAQPIAINGLMIFQSKAGTLAAYRIQ
jgi:hypothetical protein